MGLCWLSIRLHSWLRGFLCSLSPPASSRGHSRGQRGRGDTHQSFPLLQRCSNVGLTQTGSSLEFSVSPLCFSPFFFFFLFSFFLAAGRMFKVANKFQLMKPEKPELGAKRNKSNQYRRNRKRILKASLGIITC